MKTLLYPIRAAAKQTGISIDTLRAWEKRYQVVAPQRDERGRLYTEADMQRLSLLNAAVEKGHAIGRVAALSNKELLALIAVAEVMPNEFAPLPTMRAAGPVTAPRPVPRPVMEAIERLDYAEAERELALLGQLVEPAVPLI